MFWTTLDSDSILDSPSASASPKFPPKFPRTCRRTLFFAREEGKQRESVDHLLHPSKPKPAPDHKKNTMLYDPNR